MIEFLIFTIIVALIAAFVIMLLTKWGVVEWVQVHGNNLFSEMFHCNFCLSFWAGVIVSMFVAAITGNPVLLLIPFCSTMITRYLL